MGGCNKGRFNRRETKEKFVIFYDRAQSGHGLSLEEYAEGYTGIWYFHGFQGQNLFATLGYGTKDEKGDIKFKLSEVSSTGFPVGSNVDTRDCGTMTVRFKDPYNNVAGIDMVAVIDSRMLFGNGPQFSPPPPPTYTYQGSLSLLAG
jgi:hypothetical protein